MTRYSKLIASAGLGVLAVAATGGQAEAQGKGQDAVAAFYKGKTLRFIVGVSAGSGYDINARSVARHIAKYIPGKPDVIVQNQPGAGSMTMANMLYVQGPKDGLAIGVPFNGMPTAPLFQPESARFDSAKINWIGSTNRETQVTYVWHTAPVKSFADIAKTELVVGAQAPGSTQYDYPALANALFGFKFKIVTGYKGTPLIHKAMESGEIHGNGATNWSTLKSLIPEWIKDKKIQVLGQWSVKANPELPGVPLVLDFAKTEADKQALRSMLYRLEYGRPFFMPPDVPAERVNAIRRAFDATMKDKDFLAEAARSKLEIDAMTGEEMSDVIKQVFATPKDVIARVRQALAVKK
jgi:tripartite-type tricarboxylate transporter receptor subunit TctC